VTRTFNLLSFFKLFTCLEEYYIKTRFFITQLIMRCVISRVIRNLVLMINIVFLWR